LLFEAIGWKIQHIPQLQLNRTLKEKPDYAVSELRNKDKIYITKDFPALSKPEEALAEKIFTDFIQGKKSKKNYSMELAVKNFCEKNLIELEEIQEKYIAFVLESIVNGFGVLNNFLANNDLEEIAVIGTGKAKPVFVYHKSFGWLKTNVFFKNDQAVTDAANKMALKIGRHLSFYNPYINAFLPDGSRLNACMPPMALEPTLTIRKFRETPFTPADLIKNKTISSHAMAFLWMAMATDLSILISGNTGSGKTSTLNALFAFVPKNERIIIAEETPEIVLAHDHVARLKTVESIDISMEEMITNTLRMRPDRIIVGEIRTKEEVTAFVNTMLSGQGKGSVATFHAKSAQETIQRLEKLGVKETDIGAIDLVIVQKRWDKIDLLKKTRTETRKVTEISEILSSQGQSRLNTVFEFNYAKNCIEEKNKSSRVMEKICRSFGVSEKQAFKEIGKRADFLEKMKEKETPIQEFFRLVNDEF